MKQKIIILSHCFFNDAAKLKHQNEKEQSAERQTKRAILQKLIEKDIEFIQLPCPEFILYGSNRWGHAASQFDTPYFRSESRKLLEPFILQLQEYAKEEDRFEILGIAGIDGSPSCGVNYTYDGDWGGELLSHPHLDSALHALKQVQKPGIFMDVLKTMLRESNLDIPMFSYNEVLDRL